MEEIAGRYTDDATARELIGQLIEGGEHPPGEVRRELVEGDAAVGRALVAIVEDRKLADEEAPGGGWTVIRAAEVLGERREQPAVDALVDLVVDLDPNAIATTAAIRALRKIGQPAREVVREAIDDVDNDQIAEALRQVLPGHETPSSHEADETYRKSQREELGRNDPCWCGSGRKYKHCHFREDNR